MSVSFDGRRNKFKVMKEPEIRLIVQKSFLSPTIYVSSLQKSKFGYGAEVSKYDEGV
jgi:hypothetical protein